MALRDAMWLENAGPVYNAGDYRRVLEGIFGVAGIARPGDLVVTQQSPVAMGVAVARGIGYVAGTENTNQGLYSIANDASVNLSVAAAHATLARIDLVCIRIRDDEYSGTSHVADLYVVTGTPASTPAVPSAPANSMVLAQVAVAAAASSITSVNITDLRICTGPWGAAWGRVGRGIRTSDSSAVTGNTPTDVITASPLFTVYLGRTYRFQAVARVTGNTNGTSQTAYIVDGSNVILMASTIDSGVQVHSFAVNWDATFTGLMGLKLQILTSGSATTTVNASTVSPAQLIAYDEGPAR
jgi:hypothetical protein